MEPRVRIELTSPVYKTGHRHQCLHGKKWSGWEESNPRSWFPKPGPQPLGYTPKHRQRFSRNLVRGFLLMRSPVYRSLTVTAPNGAAR